VLCDHAGMARLSVAIWPPPGVVAIVSGLPRPPTEVCTGPTGTVAGQAAPLGHVADGLVEPLVEAIGDALDVPNGCAARWGPRHGGSAANGWACRYGPDTLAAAVFEATAPLVPVTHPQPFQADIVLAGAGAPPAGRHSRGRQLGRRHRHAGRRPLRAGAPRFTDLAEFALLA